MTTDLPDALTSTRDVFSHLKSDLVKLLKRAHGVRGRVIAMFFWSGHQEDGLNVALDAIQSVFEPDFVPRGSTTADTSAIEE